MGLSEMRTHVINTCINANTVVEPHHNRSYWTRFH